MNEWSGKVHSFSSLTCDENWSSGKVSLLDNVTEQLDDNYVNEIALAMFLEHPDPLTHLHLAILARLPLLIYGTLQ